MYILQPQIYLVKLCTRTDKGIYIGIGIVIAIAIGIAYP